MFVDGGDAGHWLADLLDERDETTDLVLATPRDDLLVDREVADCLRVPLNVVAISEVGAPDNLELAVGVAAGDGSTRWNRDLPSYLDIGEDYLDRGREYEAATARDKVSLYHGGDPFPGVTEKCMTVVDDGIATGATARAYLRQVVVGGAKHVVLAVPVGPPNTLSGLGAEYDTVVAVESSKAFGAVGAFYRDSVQISNEEVTTYLRDGAGKH